MQAVHLIWHPWRNFQEHAQSNLNLHTWCAEPDVQSGARLCNNMLQNCWTLAFMASARPSRNSDKGADAPRVHMLDNAE